MKNLLACVLLTLTALPTAVLAQKAELPLEPDHTVPVDLTEGTWISLDVSPDGSTIVFDYLGDLFTMPFEGGLAKRITRGLAFDAQPRFSPDGSRIVFTSDRDGGQNIWLMDLADSTFTRVTKGGTNRAESPDWIDDDFVVASVGGFRGGGLPTLNMYHVKGSGGFDLMPDANGQKMLGAAVSGDGRYVWFARRTGDWQYNAQFPQYSIETFDRETGERTTKISRYGSAIRPTPSPDGRWLVFGTRHDASTGLMVRDLQTEEDHWLAYPIQHDDQESRATLDVLPGMSFTPDSRFLVVSYGGKIWKLPIEGGPAEEIPFRVRFDLDLAPRVHFNYPIEDTPTFVVRQIRDGVPSPDGSMIAFTAMDRLWVANADGSNPRRLTELEEAEHYPVFSPDGEWIAFATWNGSTGNLMKVRSNGRGDAVRLSNREGLYFEPAWAPDGRIVAFREDVQAYETEGALGEGSRRILWFPSDPEGSDGSEARDIGPTEGRSDAHFVNGSDRIYLRRGDTLISIRWDDTDEKEYVKVRGPRPAGSTSALGPDVLRMSPNGDMAMAAIQNNIYTVDVPKVGAAPTINVGNPDSAPVPARRLTEVGGEFPAWSADGRKVHFSMGNAWFTYDLDAAQAFDDSVKAANKMEEEKEEDGDEGMEDAGDQEKGDEAAEKEEGDKEKAAYQPLEVRVRIEARRDIPQGVAVLRGARVITMRSDEVIENADVVIRNNRIEAVGASGEVLVPDGATVIDMSGKTIVPGFVDTHAHLRARYGIHRTDVWPFLVNLAYGVTTTRDPQTGNTEVLSYGDMVRADQVLGPRIYSTGPGVFWQENIDSQEKATNVLKRYSDYYDTKTIKMYVSAVRKGRQYIIKAAKELGLMPTSEGSLNIKQNLSETLDGYPGHEHSLPIYPIYADWVQLFVETQRAYTPTLLVSYGGPWAENYYYSRENPHDDPKLRRFTPHNEVDSRTLRRSQWFQDDMHVFKKHAEFAKNLVEAGGLVGVGSHGQLQGLGYHWELWSIASGGMKAHDALRVATLLGATALGLDQDLGSIEPGKLADLVILGENPLEDIRNSNTIDAVMKNGRLYNGDTLDETYPLERPLAPLWWWNSEPAGVPGVGSN